MRLNDWQSCANLVTSSDDFANARSYAFEDDSPSSAGNCWEDNYHDGTPSSEQPTYDNNETSEKVHNINATKWRNPTQSAKKKSARKRPSKSSYKHVPHREKPPHLVARRNARERRRVQAVNTAFARLRKCVPLENRNKRLSKVKTLQRAIEYINNLQDLLDDYEAISPNSLALASTAGFASHQNPSSVPVNGRPQRTSPAVSCCTANVDASTLVDNLDDFMETASLVNKENEGGQRWISLENSVMSDGFGSFIPFYDDFNPGPLHA